MHRTAEVGIKLLGIYVAVGGFSACAGSTASLLQLRTMLDATAGNYLLAMGVSALAAFAFHFVPGVLPIRWSAGIARRLFPEPHDPPPDAVWLRGGYLLGCTIVGLLFVISGAATFAGGLIQVVAIPFVDARSSFLTISALEPPGAGSVELALGFLVYRHAESQSRSLVA